MTSQSNKKESESPSVVSSITALREKLHDAEREIQRLETRGAEVLAATGVRIGALVEQLERAERERDLAIAHDRQPYPTADAYEQVCAARDKWQARAVGAERREAALRELLVESQESIGGDWRARRDAALASPAPPQPQEQKDFTRGGSPGAQ